MKRTVLVTGTVGAALLILGTAALEEEKPAVIALPEPQMDTGMPLMRALKKRRSTRSFSSKQLSPQILSNLLWAAFGVNRPGSGKRTAPSAINWQEIDIYVALPEGLYLYDAKGNQLKPVLAKDIRADTGKQDFTQKAPVNLVYVADYSRMTGDFDKNFYAAADTGFISQNAYLYCASEGLATVIIGWVDKPALEKIMKLRNDQKVILTQPVGYPPTK